IATGVYGAFELEDQLISGGVPHMQGVAGIGKGRGRRQQRPVGSERDETGVLATGLQLPHDIAGGDVEDQYSRSTTRGSHELTRWIQGQLVDATLLTGAEPASGVERLHEIAVVSVPYVHVTADDAGHQRTGAVDAQRD